MANVVFSFSDLKYFFECPYQFKLRILYGFNAPIHEALGYGKSLHDALAEVHARQSAGRSRTPTRCRPGRNASAHAVCVPAWEKLEAAAEKVVRDYLHANQALFDKIEFSEKTIEISLGDGVSVVGRIDLVRRSIPAKRRSSI